MMKMLLLAFDKAIDLFRGKLQGKKYLDFRSSYCRKFKNWNNPSVGMGKEVETKFFFPGFFITNLKAKKTCSSNCLSFRKHLVDRLIPNHSLFTQTSNKKCNGFVFRYFGFLVRHYTDPPKRINPEQMVYRKLRTDTKYNKKYGNLNLPR